MGILSGSMTYNAYYVGNYDPNDLEYMEWFDIFKKNTFKDINIEKGEKESFGLVDSKNIFSSDLNFNNTFIENYLYINFRKDVMKLQKKVVDNYAKEIYEKFFINKRLTTQLKKEINTRAEAKYMKQVLPTVNSYEIVMNIETRMLYFFNQSENLNEKFVEFFSRILNITMTKIDMSSFMALNVDSENLDKLSPSVLSLPDEKIIIGDE